MTPLPDDALVVRGGQNLPTNFAQASAPTVSTEGILEAISVNAGAGLSLQDLAAANPLTGYPGIPHNRVGVTTAGAVRSAGGDVVSTPTRANPHHARLSGLTPEQASSLFRPTVRNPSRRV